MYEPDEAMYEPDEAWICQSELESLDCLLLDHSYGLGLHFEMSPRLGKSG